MCLKSLCHLKDHLMNWVFVSYSVLIKIHSERVTWGTKNGGAQERAWAWLRDGFWGSCGGQRSAPALLVLPQSYNIICNRSSGFSGRRQDPTANTNGIKIARLVHGQLILSLGGAKLGRPMVNKILVKMSSFKKKRLQICMALYSLEQLLFSLEYCWTLLSETIARVSIKPRRLIHHWLTTLPILILSTVITHMLFVPDTLHSESRRKEKVCPETFTGWFHTWYYISQCFGFLQKWMFGM